MTNEERRKSRKNRRKKEKEEVVNEYKDLPGYSLHPLSDELILRIPEAWTVVKKEAGRMGFESPKGEVYLSVTAYQMEGKSLGDFAEVCFTKAVPEVYHSINKPQTIKNALIQEFKGVWDGDKYDSYYYVACVKVITNTSHYFLVFNYTTVEDFLEANRVTFSEIPNSVLTKELRN